MKLQLRAEVFNIFNRVNFLGNDGNVQTTYDPQNVVFDTGSAAHRDAHRERHAGGQLRTAHCRTSTRGRCSWAFGSRSERTLLPRTGCERA